MGRSTREARSSLRFSLGHTTGDGDVDRLLAVLPGVVELARRAG
jgi:cysteine desulfurase